MQRDKKIDGLKFILIYLVVLGHLTYNDYGIGLNKMIYSFHMPVFVFLSGFFTSRKENKEKQIKWLKRTVIILLIAQFGHILVDMVYRYLSAIKNNETTYHILRLDDFTTPKFALWYILCLMYWRFITWNIINRIIRINDVALLISSFILSILVGVIPIGQTLSFQRAFTFFPFFVLGFVFKNRNLIIRLYKIPIFVPILLLMIGFIVSRQLPLFQPRGHYENWNDLVLRIIQSVIGLILCVSVIRLSKASKLIERFAKYGIFTLWIYIGHTFLIVIERKILPQLDLPLSYNIAIAIIIASIYCTFFILLAKYTRHLHNKTS